MWQGILAAFNFILLVLKNLPEIIAIIKKIEEVWDEATDKLDQKQKTEEIKKAIDHAKSTKDTSALEKVFSGQGFDMKLVEPEPVLVLPVGLEEKKSLELDLTTNSFDLSLPEEKIETVSVETIKDKDEGPGVIARAMSFMGGIILDPTDPPNVYQNNFTSGSPRMSSKWIPLIILFLPFLGGCLGKKVKNQPDYSPSLYAGDAENNGITRAQTNEHIKAADPRFNNFVCTPYQHLACLKRTYIDNCKEFKKAVVDCSDLEPQDGQELVEILNNL